MNSIKLEAVKRFYKYVMDLTSGYMPDDMQEAMLECFVFNDEDSYEMLVKTVMEWYKSLPNVGKLELAHSVNTLMKIIYPL